MSLSFTGPEKSEKPRLDSLDGLRGLAVLGVLIAHYNPSPAAPNPDTLVGQIMQHASEYCIGNISVLLFFGLSAFIITKLAYLENLRTGSFSIKNFYIKRAFRILPLYLCSVSVAYLLYSNYKYLPPSFGSSEQAWVWLKKNIYIYLCFISNWSLNLNYIGGHIDISPGTLRILWSLAVEVQFYALMPLIFILLLKWKKARPIILGGITCVALIGQWILLSWPVDNFDIKQAGGMYYSTFTYILIFLINGMAGYVSCGTKNKYVQVVQKIKGLDMLLLCVCIILARMLYNVIWHPYLPKHMFVLIFSGLGIVSSLFILRVSGSESSLCTSFLRLKPLVFLGQVSYGIYIWHIISNACLSAVFSRYLQKASGSLLFGYLILSILSAIIWGTASHYVIERPFLRLKETFNK